MKIIKSIKQASLLKIEQNSKVRRIVVIITLLIEVLSVLLIGLFLKSYI